VWVWLGVLLLGGTFSWKGGQDAKLLAAGRAGRRVRVETRTPLNLPSNLVLVAHTGSEFVLCEPKKPNPHPEAIVIDAAEVTKITTYRNP
jgi:hypothetical protein